MQSIEWRPVVGYETRYEVSSMGQVRSILTRAGNPQKRILKPGPNSDGRMSVDLLTRTVYVHRIVAKAFHGVPSDPSLVVCHNNGDHTDNRSDNLRWDTASGNVQDSLRHGTHNQASKTHCPQGHEYSAENTYLNVRLNRRLCRTCRAADSQRRKARGYLNTDGTPSARQASRT